MTKLRFEKPEDIAFIHFVKEQAFGRVSEAKLVGTLRQTCADHLSLVADDNDFIVGHIMLTPVIVSVTNLTMHRNKCCRVSFTKRAISHIVS